MALLEITNLSVEFATAHGSLKAVDQVSLSLDAGDIVAIVGESGSGKSVTALSIPLLRSIGFAPAVTFKQLLFEVEIKNKELESDVEIIGKDISMIFQEPMTALNPLETIGTQIMEAIKLTNPKIRYKDLLKKAELIQVGIPAAESRLNSYPHQLSGGMCQRVMIAMMIACKPKLLIADEPTTALDVTIQAQILELLIELQQSHGMALVLITHDMAVVAETAERVIVLYAGQQVEQRKVKELFEHPKHPYSEALLNALPERAQDKLLNAIPGVVPGQMDRPKGCLFSPRCDYAEDLCSQEKAPLNDGILCHFPLDLSKSKKTKAINLETE